MQDQACSKEHLVQANGEVDGKGMESLQQPRLRLRLGQRLGGLELSTYYQLDSKVYSCVVEPQPVAQAGHISLRY